MPQIQWKVVRRGSNQIYFPLPSDDSHFAIQSRGGPGKSEITSWLQIIGIKSNDEGEYHCIATNSEGEDTAYGNLVLIEKNPKLKTNRVI